MNEETLNRPSLHVLDTAFSACSAEFCPRKAAQRFLAVGTYQLAKPEEDVQVESVPEMSESIEDNKDDEGAGDCKGDAPMRRMGRLMLYEVVRQNTEESPKLVERQCIETAAILDSKWAPRTASDTVPPLLAVADAVGAVSIFSLAEEHEQSKFSKVMSVSTNDDAKLCLSLDWGGSSAVKSASLAVSRSDGALVVLDVSDHGLKVSREWDAHNFEAWITAFDRGDPSVIYSGGDDCKFKGWDLRTDCSSATFTNRRHEMGVTAIESNTLAPHVLASGSYDERVLLWDRRNIRQPLHDISTGGGIWRLRWHPFRQDLLLAACMHGGLRVIRVGNEKCEIVSSFVEHQSMAYGADWSREEPRHVQGGKEEFGLISSCSFYDHVVHLWETNLNF